MEWGIWSLERLDGGRAAPARERPALLLTGTRASSRRGRSSRENGRDDIGAPPIRGGTIPAGMPRAGIHPDPPPVPTGAVPPPTTKTTSTQKFRFS